MGASGGQVKSESARRCTMGLISDTRGLLRPEALKELRGVEFLVHAGDIGSPDILLKLAELAPLTAVRGNNDVAAWAASVPDGIAVRCLSAPAAGSRLAARACG